MKFEYASQFQQLERAEKLYIQPLSFGTRRYAVYVQIGSRALEILWPGHSMAKNPELLVHQVRVRHTTQFRNVWTYHFYVPGEGMSPEHEIAVELKKYAPTAEIYYLGNAGFSRIV